MIGQDFVDRYRRDLDEQMGELIEPLVKGQAETIEHYRENTGKIAAFQRARELFDALVKRVNEGSL